MIRLISRRFAALVVALAFALVMGEGLLAAACPPEGETGACAGLEIEGEMTAFDADMEAPGVGCCPPPGSDGEPISGDDERAPCPFAPMGVTGACQGLVLPASAHSPLPPAADALSVTDPHLQAQDLLLAWIPFQPPRA